MEDGTSAHYDSIYLGVSPSANQVYVRIDSENDSHFNDNIAVSNLRSDWNQIVYTYDGS